MAEMSANFTYNDENIITSFYSTSPCQFRVIVNCAITSATCSRAEDIYTTYSSELNDLAIANTKDIYSYILTLNLNTDIIIKHLESIKTDDDLKKLICRGTYLFLEHTIRTTKQYFIKTNKLLPKIEGCKIEQFKMIHSSETEAKLKHKPTKFFTHGSPLENWNNIFQKGLLVPSGDKSKLLINANLYGCGIYISSSPNYSLGYCNSKITKNNHFILAICEVIETAANHKQDCIYLVTEENALLLRYIICFDSITIINKKFIEEINKILFNLSINIKENEKRHRRLSIELERVKSEVGIIANPIFKASKFITSWDVSITDFGINQTFLIKQLQEQNIKSIELQFIFGANYPFSPPFIRIIRPRLKYISDKYLICRGTEYDFLDNGGGICTSLFKTDEWLPSYPLVKLILYLQYLILSSEILQLAPNWDIPYTEMEVLQYFDKTMASYSLDEAVEILEASK